MIDSDLTIRHFVYDHFVRESKPPSVQKIAAQFKLSEEEAAAAYQRLHNGHFFFLEPGTVNIRMANPFSAVPTDFRVEIAGKSYWANCAWDMFGISAAINADAKIEAQYSDTQKPAFFSVENGEPTGDPGVVHFSLPVRQW